MMSIGAAVLTLLSRGWFEGIGGVETGVVSGVLGLVCCGAPFALLAVAGSRVGWGDVRMLALVGLALGFPRALTALMLISVCGAAGAVFFVWKRRGSANLPAGAEAERGRAERGRGEGGHLEGVVTPGWRIPYGVPIAVGTWWAIMWAGPALPDDAVMPEEAAVFEGVTEVDGGQGAAME
jgi:prepilin peptidase CpaA